MGKILKNSYAFPDGEKLAPRKRPMKAGHGQIETGGHPASLEQPITQHERKRPSKPGRIPNQDLSADRPVQ